MKKTNKNDGVNRSVIIWEITIYGKLPTKAYK